MAARLGHANVSTTQGIYAHLLRPGQERAAKTIGVLYNKAAR